MRSVCWLFVLLLACQGRHEESPTIPEPLAVLPGTGVLPIAMNGDWLVDEVHVLQEAGNATQPPPDPAGFMPPAVGANLRVSSDRAREAGGRDLSLAVCGVGTVSDWVNHVDGRQLIFSRYHAASSQPGLADSGGSQLLQFSLGSVDADTMSGLVHHQLVTAFPPRDRPVSGLYRVVMRRVTALPPATTSR